MKQRLFEERLQYFLTQRMTDEGTINAMMDMKLVSADYEHKTVILEFPVCAWQMNPAGSLHGGIIATALDITMGCIAYISSEAVFTPTIQMAVNFVGGVLWLRGFAIMTEAGWHRQEQLPKQRAAERSWLQQMAPML